MTTQLIHFTQWAREAPQPRYTALMGLLCDPEGLRMSFDSQPGNYVSFVHEGARLPSIWSQLQGQIYLGSESFVHKMQALIDQKPTLDEIPKAQRRAITQPLSEFEKNFERNKGMAQAYLSGQHTLAAIARHFGVHYATVSRAVKSLEKKKTG